MYNLSKTSKKRANCNEQKALRAKLRAKLPINYSELIMAKDQEIKRFEVYRFFDCSLKNLEKSSKILTAIGSVISDMEAEQARQEQEIQKLAS